MALVSAGSRVGRRTVEDDGMQGIVSLILSAILMINSMWAVLNPGPPPTSYERPALLVHDVSPWYCGYLKQIISVTDRCGYADRTYLFVIVNHAGQADMRKYPEFVSYLHELEERGYHIELHGYDHVGREYDVSYSEALKDLVEALSEMYELGFVPHYIFPPRNALSGEALMAMHRFALEVITADKFYAPNGRGYPVMAREYTWYVETKEQRNRAWAEFVRDVRQAKQKGIPFYLSIHPKAVNAGFGLSILEDMICSR